MTTRELSEVIACNPVVAAVKNEEGLLKCLETDIGIIFVLYGDVCSVSEIVRRIKEKGKVAMVHIDLITGLSPKEVSVDYIRECTEADGIITTRANLIPRAKALGLNTVLRFFMLDSLALMNVEKQARQELQPDIIELLPGILQTSFMSKVVKISRVPVMAGGLITDKQEVISALKSGVIAISTTNQKLWTES